MRNLNMRDFHVACGIIYLLVCVCDFIVFPIYTSFRNAGLTAAKQAEIAETFKDPASQIQAFMALHQTTTWQPITLQQNALFHVTFGSILGIGIWARRRDPTTDGNTPSNPPAPGGAS